MYIFFFLYGFCICIDSFAGDFLPCLSFYVIMVVLYMKICNIWKTDNVIYNLIFFYGPVNQFVSFKTET